MKYLAIMDVTYTPEECNCFDDSRTEDTETGHARFPKWAAIPGEWHETSSIEDRTHKWVAELTPAEWDKLRSDWSLEYEDSEPNLGSLTEYGHLPAWAFNADGMDFNSGGWTPIEYVSMYVSPLPESDEEAQRFSLNDRGILIEEAGE